LARTQVKHYYTQRLMQRAFWSKLLSGKVALKAFKDLARNLRLARGNNALPRMETKPFQERMAIAWNDFNGRILLLLSDNDYTAKEFLEYVKKDTAWLSIFKHLYLERHDIANADHTFSDPTAKMQVEIHVQHWIQAGYPSKKG
jgi:hypothetical protein